MPPTKRTAAEANASSNTSDANKTRRTPSDQPEEGRDGQADASDQEHNIEDDEDDEEQGPQNAARVEFGGQFDKGHLLKPAAENPDHRYIGTWATWKLFAEYKRRATYVDPDNFGMYIYNDFAGYGLQELIENLLIAFDHEFKKKDRSEETIKLMWSTVAASGHWLSADQFGPWTGVDDGEKISVTVGVIGNMLLTMLNELDRADMLKADSPIRDLGLVMGIFLSWGHEMRGFAFDGEETDWLENVLGYAAKADIDLRQSPLYTLGKTLDRMREEYDEPVALEGAAKADRWGWKKSMTKLRKLTGKLGGTQYDITKMSRQQRITHSFDKVDPLAGISAKDLKEGNLMLA